MTTDHNKDEFWKLVLSHDPCDDPHRFIRRPLSDGEYEDQGDADTIHEQRFRIYHLPHVTLRLSPLPDSTGIWSPVGAKIWHASAVVATLPFNFSSVDSVVEIGSGAVGLTGLSIAVKLADPAKQIILTDLDEDGMLDNLRSNVTSNLSVFDQSHLQHAGVQIQKLDWRKEGDIAKLPPLNLVIGSELIYTDETSNACAKMVHSLLNLNPGLTVLIVQVADRPGWSEFLSRFEGIPTVTVMLQAVPMEWHDRASAAVGVEALGTMSRSDYCLCTILSGKRDGAPILDLSNISN